MNPVIDLKVFNDDYVPGVPSLLGKRGTVDGLPFKYDMSMRSSEEMGMWKQGDPFGASRGFGANLWRAMRLNISLVNTGTEPWVIGNPWKDPGLFQATPLWWAAAKFWRVELRDGGELVQDFEGFSVLGVKLPVVPGGTPFTGDENAEVLMPLHYTYAGAWVDYAILDLSQVEDGTYDFRFILNPDGIGGANSVTVDTTLKVNALEGTLNG